MQMSFFIILSGFLLNLLLRFLKKAKKTIIIDFCSEGPKILKNCTNLPHSWLCQLDFFLV
jgi:hypothetical protein